MKTTVTFVYDEPSSKWDVFVNGVKDDLEARQAFNAVIITTCYNATLKIDHSKADKQEDGSYKISVGV